MKKFMLFVFLTTIIAFLAASISFFVFDLSNIIVQSEIRRQAQAEQQISVGVFEDFGDRLDRFTENVVDRFSENIMEDFTNIVDPNILDINLDYDDILKKGFPFYNESGYITREDIVKNDKYYIHKEMEVNVDGIEEIVVDISEKNVLFARTEGAKMKVYAASVQGYESFEVETAMSEDGVYTITSKGEDKNFAKGFLFRSEQIIVLLPDNFSKKVKVQIHNGNIVGIYQTKGFDINISNGNAVLSQQDNMPLTVNIDNGNIIVKLENYNDYHFIAEAVNGMFIGKGKISGNRTEMKYGEGTVKVELKVQNGNIISQ